MCALVERELQHPRCLPVVEPTVDSLGEVARATSRCGDHRANMATIGATTSGKLRSLRQASFPEQSSLMCQDRSAFIRSIISSCKRAPRVLCRLNAVPMPMRVVVIGIAFLAVCSVVNLFYQMLHKPTEVFAPISSEFNKAPIETSHQYAPLFRAYSSVSIPPELLAALAQVESAGNPVASTYWRLRSAAGVFVAYQPSL